MTDYKNFTLRMIDIGLNLRETPDKVKEGYWTKITNIDPSHEAAINTRPGRNASITLNQSGAILIGSGYTDDVHTIKRISSTELLSGAGDVIFKNTEPLLNGYNGQPLTMTPFHPAVSSSVWTYIGSSAQFKKVKGDGTVYKWGVTAPIVASSFTAGAAGNLDSSVAGASTYDWRYTYYSTSTGAESNGSPTATSVSVVAKKGLVAVNASADPQVDEIRIYRRGGVNGGTVWRFSLAVPNNTNTVEDNNSDSTIALNEALLEDGDVPFSSVGSSGNELKEVPLPYIAGPFLGKYIIACGDSNRPGYVYWTNAERPDTADVDNNLQVTSPNEPLIASLIFSSQPFVFSRENLYVLDYGGVSDLSTFTSRLTPCGRGLAAPWAFDVGDLIVFVSQDGIYTTDGQGPAESLTEESIRPLFEGISVSGMSPIDLTQTNDLRLQIVGKQIHFLYKDTLGARQHLVYHYLYKRWGKTSGVEVTCVYGDENQNVVKPTFGTALGTILVGSRGNLTDDGTAISVNARTGSLDFGLPQTYKEFGNLIIDADPGGNTITITPYLNSETSFLTPLTISGSGRQKFSLSLSDTYAYSIAFDLSWSGQATVYQMELLWREDEEPIKHWEFPATAHEMSGWQHVRDMYVTLRSTAAVTLTVEIDGRTKTYSIPSTSGSRLKQLVHLDPRKGKMFRYSLDSSEVFRIYGEDSEVRVKEWNTGLGYRLLSPFSVVEGGT